MNVSLPISFLPFLLLKEGKQAVTVEVATLRIQEIMPGDVIYYDYDGEICRRQVVSRLWHQDFASVLQHHTPETIWPGLTNDELIGFLRRRHESYMDLCIRFGLISFKLCTVSLPTLD